MKRLSLLAALAAVVVLASQAPALSVEQVIRMRQAGVSDQTILVIMDREGLSISADEVKKLKSAGVSDKTIQLILLLRQRRYELRRQDGVRRVITNPDGSQEVVITSGVNPEADAAEARAEAAQRRQAWDMLKQMIIQKKLGR